MQVLYVSQQGCYVSLQQEMAVVKQGETVLAQVQLPLLEMILIFGKSQVTTQMIRACLQRDIPLAFLSRMGYCYGRLIPIERGYRQLGRYQQQLSAIERLVIARTCVKAKLKNSRVILQRQLRKRQSPTLEQAVSHLEYLATQAMQAQTLYEME